ncbi:MAG: Fe-S cluster assembly ATPase SufC [Epulopiscium sp.]|nr:Fe-S cluster assembly ATPase SufC [Candidatus Epulonipiscium sp.]
MSNKLLTINNLHAKIGENDILKGLNLEIEKGEVHVIMGPNGAGKSTLANILMGHPKYAITKGLINFLNQPVNDLKVDERARLGMFLSFQYPEEIPGITVESFLRSAKMAKTGEPIKIFAFREMLKEKMELLGIQQEYSLRYLNEGFSGGEKKKNEILQMLILEPKLAILDETDSGLDVDAVRVVATGVKQYMNPENAVIIITHHSSILEYLEPDFVHILIDGKIIKTGNLNLIEEIEKDGFDKFRCHM